jgi:hypothetical protein
MYEGSTSITFDGIISTAGDGRCRSLSETTGTQLVALLGTKPGKHRTSSDGAFIALPVKFSKKAEDIQLKLGFALTEE